MHILPLKKNRSWNAQSDPKFSQTGGDISYTNDSKKKIL
jgi:hypothetical protein